MVQMIIDSKLLELNRKGIIPGPHESEAAFFKRAEYCLSLFSLLRNQHANTFPFALELSHSPELLHSALAKTRDYFDIEPDWIPVFFSNYRLAPWHGGCAWIFQISQNTPIGALLQLQKTFLHKSSYLGIYHRDELIAHELAHVGRMAFNEPKFEELFAYSTASSNFRSMFGPIIQSAKESLLFVLVLIGTLAADLSTLLTPYYDYFPLVAWFKVIPISLILFALLRLRGRHIQYTKCARNLTPLLKTDFKVQATLYRLNDKEIIEFSQMSTNEISKYIAKHRHDSLRWKIITQIYFKPFNN
jgi:hypothetical protein